MTPTHDSMRGWFAASLHEAMSRDERIWTITPDLGFGCLDQIRNDFPKRFLNCGASEQLALGIAVGMSQAGLVPFVYSITPFLLCRPFEWLRNFVQHEGAAVRLVGSGYEDDYKHDGFTHHAFDAKAILELFPRISRYFPVDKTQVPYMVEKMIADTQPSFLCLRR